MTQLTKRERLDKLEEEIRDLLAEDAAPKWSGTGRPPVGAVCEKAPNWHKVEILASHDGGLVVYDFHDLAYYKVGLSMSFRPILTQAQREREELLTSIIEDYRTSFNSPVSTVELNLISEFANYLFEIGMLRRAGE